MVERLRSIPGIGLLIATALVAFVGDIRTWALDLERRVGHNKAAVAFANKLALRACESLPRAA